MAALTLEQRKKVENKMVLKKHYFFLFCLPFLDSNVEFDVIYSTHNMLLTISFGRAQSNCPHSVISCLRRDTNARL